MRDRAGLALWSASRIYVRSAVALGQPPKLPMGPFGMDASSPRTVATLSGQSLIGEDGSRGGDAKIGRASQRVSFMAAGALSLSFAASATSVAWAKERVPEKYLPRDVVLYQYEACPFCNKVKAFLDYHDIPYKVVEVNPMGKRELKWSEYKKVPVLLVDGEQINDSTVIITTLNQRIKGDTSHANSVASSSAEDEEEKWRRWVDEHLVHLLSPNMYRTPKEALEAFEYISTNGNFTAMERTTGKYFGAVAMYFIGKRLKKRHHITNERTCLYEAANEWVQALNDRTFLGGSKPSLADLAVFGVLKPIRHLQAGRDLIAYTRIGDWYMHMEEAVGPSARLREEAVL